MSKKTSMRKGTKQAQLARSRRKIHPKIIGFSLLILLSFGVAVGAWTASRGTLLRAFRPAPNPVPVAPSPGSPSREYIYAGNRLIATEEPAGANLAAPSNLWATTASAAQVDISWAASPGANHYQIERAQTLALGYTVISANVLTTNFTDTGVTAGTAYLYRVRAADANGSLSPYSNIDLATAITFSDDPLVSGVTLVKAEHISQLRQAVNAARTTANLSAAAWTDSSLSGVAIKAIHIQELRTNLDQALTQLGLVVAPYTDASLSGVEVKKVHTEEIRQRVK